jgi:hypothetical protein
MLHTIKSLFAGIRQAIFAAHIEWETYHRIAPHIHSEANHGYPFDDLKELRKAAYHGNLDAQFEIECIEREADGMGKATGDALRYIMYRDINRRLAMYQKVMNRGLLPTTCDPRFVATRA